MTAALLLLAFAAGPAAAQDPAEMAVAIEACLTEANRDPAAERACVGAAAAACLEATPGSPAACAAAEAEGWRVLADATAAALVAMAGELGVGGDGPGGQAALVARAQQAWAEFRDADCAQIAALAEPGPAQDGVVAQCRMERGADRTLSLLARRRAMEGP